MWPNVELDGCASGGTLSLSADSSGAFFAWSSGRPWNGVPSPEWVLFSHGAEATVFANPVALGDEAALPVPSKFSGALAFKRSDDLVAPGAELSVSTPVQSRRARAIAVGVRVWADRDALFLEVPRMLSGAAFWPGTGHVLPGSTEVHIEPGVDGTVFVACGSGAAVQLDSGWIAIGPTLRVVDAAGGARLMVWGRLVSRGNRLRILQPASDLAGAVFAFRAAAGLPTTDFGIDSSAPGVPEALVPGVQAWPDPPTLVADVPDVLLGTLFWTLRPPAQEDFWTDVDGTLVALVDEGDASPPPVDSEWTSVGPVVQVIDAEGSRALVGWARFVLAGSTVPILREGAKVRGLWVVFVPASDADGDVISQLANSASDAGGAGTMGTAEPLSSVSLATSAGATEPESAGVTKEPVFWLGVVLFGIVVAVGLLVAIRVKLFRRRDREFQQYSDATLPPIAVSGSCVRGKATE